MQQFNYDDILKKAKKAEGKPEMEQKIKNELSVFVFSFSAKRAQDIIKRIGK